MKTRKLFTLSSEVVEFLDNQPNKSGLVDRLIKEYSHREVRKQYVYKIIGEMVLLDINRMPETELISRLSMMLTESIIGIDVLPQVQERVEK